MSDLQQKEHPFAKIVREELALEDGRDLSTVNFGPTHPSTHGVFQNILLLDGERIIDVDTTLGYIHRAFEKIAEHKTLYQITTLTDRLNYCSAPINNMCWWMTVEKALGVEVPKRAQYMRVIVMEIARITDHLICNGILGVDLGAYSPFLYVMEYRELAYEIYEEICGARLTTNMGRIGGFERDFSPATWEKIDKFLEGFPKAWAELELAFLRNRIFMDRTVGVGSISAEKAINYGFTGPNLRATGVDYDVRVAKPYSSYEDFDFIVPVGESGDTYDRFCVRAAEVKESIKIITQARNNLPEGKYHGDVPEYYLPEKQDVYHNMEALINHFKIVMGEVPIPTTEVYHAVEAANGELGMYLVTDGSRSPFRLHFRRPCFVYYQGFPELVKGGTISDAVATLSSINVIAGELDA